MTTNNFFSPNNFLNIPALPADEYFSSAHSLLPYVNEICYWKMVAARQIIGFQFLKRRNQRSMQNVIKINQIVLYINHGHTKLSFAFDGSLCLLAEAFLGK